MVQFCVVSATALFIGTVQGVYQVMPWSLDWLRAAGKAGEMIDPMAHAHMNLVGGVSIGMMALLYFFLPRMPAAHLQLQAGPLQLLQRRRRRVRLLAGLDHPRLRGGHAHRRRPHDV